VASLEVSAVIDFALAGIGIVCLLAPQLIRLWRRRAGEPKPADDHHAHQRPARAAKNKER
jgi:hypothetical protein